MGRTCSTSPVLLKLKDNLYECEDSRYVVFYLNFEPDILHIVVEIVVYEVYEPGEAIKSTLCGVGWFLLDISLDGNVKDAQMLEGSPRLLLEDVPQRILLFILRPTQRQHYYLL